MGAFGPCCSLGYADDPRQGAFPASSFDGTRLGRVGKIIRDQGGVSGTMRPDRTEITFSNAWNGAYFHCAEGSPNGEIVTRRFGPLRRGLEECLMSDHTIKAYDEELELLDHKIAEMGAIAEKLLSDAMESLFNFDADLAYATISGDLRLDILERDIEEQAIATIARRQPLAADLRELIVTIRIPSDLERVGDLAKNIAKRVIKIKPQLGMPRCIIGLRSMHELAATLLKDALDAYAHRDAERARGVWMRDADLDALQHSVFRDLLAFMMENPHNIVF